MLWWLSSIRIPKSNGSQAIKRWLRRVRIFSSPRFETVATIARELNISLDASVFQNIKTDSVSKSVVDFFSGKSEEEIQKYILLCQQADTFKSEN